MMLHWSKTLIGMGPDRSSATSHYAPTVPPVGTETQRFSITHRSVAASWRRDRSNPSDDLHPHRNRYRHESTHRRERDRASSHLQSSGHPCRVPDVGPNRLAERFGSDVAKAP